MKKLVCAILLIFLSLQAYSQKIRFTDITNQWKVVDGIIGPPSGEYYSRQYYSGTTIIGTFIYNVLTGDGIGMDSTANIWEDTFSHKVIVKINDTVEEVLMDYNLKLGDTVIHFSTKVGFPYYDSFWHIVTKIDSTYIDAIAYRVWHFKGIHASRPSLYPADYNIIEGIGSTGGPLFPLYPVQPENYWVLYCFSNNNMTPRINPPVDPYSFDNVISCTTNIKTVNKITKRLCVYPNPTNINTKIIFPNTIQSGQLMVYNQFGQVVINAIFENKDEYLIGDKISIPGLYFYRLSNKINGEVFSGKVICQ